MTHFPTLSYTSAREISTFFKRKPQKMPPFRVSPPPPPPSLPTSPMIIQKIEQVNFNPVGSQCFKSYLTKILLITKKNSVHVEPIWFSLENLTLLGRSN